jgi:hypothetical protein
MPDTCLQKLLQLVSDVLGFLHIHICRPFEPTAFSDLALVFVYTHFTFFWAADRPNESAEALFCYIVLLCMVGARTLHKTWNKHKTQRKERLTPGKQGNANKTKTIRPLFYPGGGGRDPITSRTGLGKAKS